VAGRATCEKEGKNHKDGEVKKSRRVFPGPTERRDHLERPGLEETTGGQVLTECGGERRKARLTHSETGKTKSRNKIYQAIKGKEGSLLFSHTLGGDTWKGKSPRTADKIGRTGKKKQSTYHVKPVVKEDGKEAKDSPSSGNCLKERRSKGLGEPPGNRRAGNRHFTRRRERRGGNAGLRGQGLWGFDKRVTGKEGTDERSSGGGSTGGKRS